MMGQFKRIIRWPANEVNNRAPWYAIVWRMLWLLPSGAALFTYCILVGIAYGPRMAEVTWRDNL